MKTLRLLPLLVVPLLQAGSSHSLYQACFDNATNNHAMIQCTHKELAYQDARLNRYYKRAMRRLEPDEKKRLRKAQRAWIAFRDLECEFEGRQMRGGSAEPLLIGGCLVDMTWKRADELQAIVSE